MEAGTEVNGVDANGNTPLHLVFLSEGLMRADLIVKEFIEAKASLAAKGKGGNTPLHFAASKPNSYNFPAVQLLIEAGANPKITNDDGLYPFQMIKKQPDKLLRGTERKLYNLLHFEIARH